MPKRNAISRGHVMRMDVVYSILYGKMIHIELLQH